MTLEYLDRPGTMFLKEKVFKLPLEDKQQAVEVEHYKLYQKRPRALRTAAAGEDCISTGAPGT